MPIPTFGCSEPEVCCESLWDAANDLLEYLVEGMVDCLGDTSCGGAQVVPFISLGPPQTALTDYLAVWWNTAQTRISSQVGGFGNVFVPSIVEVQWNAQLIESNYPVPQQLGDEVAVPTFEAMNAASRIVYSHGERLFRLMLGAKAVLQSCSDFKQVHMTPASVACESVGGGAGVRVTIFQAWLDPLMAIKVSLAPPQRLSVNITKAAAKKIERKLRSETGPLFVELAIHEAQNIYYFDRPGNRRRGGIHYTTAFDFDVKPGSGGTGFAALASCQGINRAKHAKALENGTGGSAIASTTEKPLRIPGRPNTPGVTSADAYGGPPFTKPFFAFAKPITGSKVSQRMMKQALRATFPR